MIQMDSVTTMSQAASAHIRRLIELRDTLTASDLAPGFQFERVRIPLITPQRFRFATGRRNGIERPPRDSGRPCECRSTNGPAAHRFAGNTSRRKRQGVFEVLASGEMKRMASPVK